MEPLLRVRKVAEILQVSERTVWRLIDSGELPHVKVGIQAVRVKESDLEGYVNRQTRRGKDESPEVSGNE